MMETFFVIFVLSLLALMGMGSFFVYQREVTIDGLAHEVAANVERAHTLSLVGFKNSIYGVHFETSKYVLFTGSVYVPTATSNEIRQLNNYRFPTPQAFSNGTGGFTSDIIFSALSGKTNNTGTIRLESVGNSGVFRSINVNSLGLVTLP